jgi:hypothetical protein
VPDAPLRVADYIFDAALRAMKQRRARLDAEEVPS